MTRLLSAAVLSFAMALAPVAEPRAEEHDPQVLRVALLPDQDPLTVIWVNKPLAAYLEERLGRPVELIVPDDYDAVIQAMTDGEVELAYFGPAAYTMARERAAAGEAGFGVEPFAARLRDGAATYESVIIAGAGTDFQEIADMEGADITIAYGDPASTSSHLAPKFTLMRAGVTDPEDYETVHLGKHDLVAAAVAAGEHPAGALSRPILERLIRTGELDAAKIRVLGYSDPLPQYPWALRDDLAQALQAELRESFYRLQHGDPQSEAVLRPFGAEGFAAMGDEDYEIIRAIRDELN